MASVGPDGGDVYRLAAAAEDERAIALPITPEHAATVAPHAGKYCLVIANIWPKDNNRDRCLTPMQVVELGDWRRRQELWLAEVAQAQAWDAPKAVNAPKAAGSLALTPPDFLDD